MDALSNNVMPLDYPSICNGDIKSINAILVITGICINITMYLPSSEGVGDRRTIYIGVNIDSVLGIKIPDLIRPQAQKFQLKALRIVQKCVNILEKHMVNTRSMKELYY